MRSCQELTGMIRTTFYLMSVFAAWTVISCRASNSDPRGATPCLGIAMPGIFLSIADSINGRNLLNGARIIVKKNGSNDDSVDIPADWQGSERWGLVHERPGVYTVVVNRAGYKPWMRQAITVRRDSCHVATGSLTANLVPSP